MHPQLEGLSEEFSHLENSTRRLIEGLIEPQLRWRPAKADSTQVNNKRPRLLDLFRGTGKSTHPAWGTMIVEGDTKGAHRLESPSKT